MGGGGVFGACTCERTAGFRGDWGGGDWGGGDHGGDHGGGDRGDWGGGDREGEAIPRCADGSVPEDDNLMACGCVVPGEHGA